MSVPSAVAISVESAAISSEFFSASLHARHGERVLPVRRALNSCQMKLKRPVVSLNEKRMMTAIGSSR